MVAGVDKGTEVFEDSPIGAACPRVNPPLRGALPGVFKPAADVEVALLFVLSDCALESTWVTPVAPPRLAPKVDFPPTPLKFKEPPVIEAPNVPDPDAEGNLNPDKPSPVFCNVPAAGAEALAVKFSCGFAAPKVTVFSEFAAASFSLSLLDNRGLSLLFVAEEDKIEVIPNPPEEVAALVASDVVGVAPVVDVVDFVESDPREKPGRVVVVEVEVEDGVADVVENKALVLAAAVEPSTCEVLGSGSCISISFR